MIEKISTKAFTGIKTPQKGNSERTPLLTKEQKEYASNYADSFTKHAVKSTPILLSLTGIWSLMDYSNSKESLRKSLVKNLKYYFLPVLIGSSVLLAYIENKKTSKNSKQ